MYVGGGSRGEGGRDIEADGRRAGWRTDRLFHINEHYFTSPVALKKKVFRHCY